MPDILPVSLVVTTFNEEATVAAFIASLAASTTLPAELVVCDAGSTDRTVELFRAAALPGVRTEVFVEAGANIAAGRNRAVVRSTQEIIATTDLGCTIDADWLARITEPLLCDPAIDVVSGGYREVGRTRFERMAAASSIAVTALDAASFLPSSRSFALRRAAFDAVGGYPEELSFAGEDTALCLRLRERGFRFEPRFDAFVTWHPRATLGAFLRQHLLYGIGDGESRMRDSFFHRVLVKWTLVVGVVVACVVAAWLLRCVALLAVPAIGAAAYYGYLAPKYRWRDRPLAERVGGFLLVAVKEWALAAGWLRARIGGTR